MSWFYNFMEVYIPHKPFRKKKTSILYVLADTDKKFKDPKVKKRVF